MGYVPLYLLLTLASYRLTRLVVKDTFPPVLWLRDLLAGGWRPLTDKEWGLVRSGKTDHVRPTREIDGVESRYVHRARWSPYWLAELITCPWCASAYVSAAVVAGTWWATGLPVPFLVWASVWAGSALLASQEWA